MQNWFTCKITYRKVMENGMEKNVTEPYLVDALSFTEAEARIIEEIRPFISGEFTVADIKRAHYANVFFNADGDRWYKVRVALITLDERTGLEKRQAARSLVQAGTLAEALSNFQDGMKGTLDDYVIIEISETPLMDVFPYTNEN